MIYSVSIKLSSMPFDSHFDSIFLLHLSLSLSISELIHSNAMHFILFHFCRSIKLKLRGTVFESPEKLYQLFIVVRTVKPIFWIFPQKCSICISKYIYSYFWSYFVCLLRRFFCICVYKFFSLFAIRQLYRWHVANRRMKKWRILCTAKSTLDGINLLNCNTLRSHTLNDKLI